MYLRILSLAIAVSLLACATHYDRDTEHRFASGAFRVDLLDSIVRPGTKVRFRLTNTGTTDLGYNVCSQTLMRRTGRDWVTVRNLPYSEIPGVEAICTVALGILPPADSTVIQSQLPPDLLSGTYRLVFHALPARRTASEPPTPSPSFRVSRPAG